MTVSKKAGHVYVGRQVWMRVVSSRGISTYWTKQAD